MKKKIFVGWDSREDIAYQVCARSILRQSRASVDIVPLKQDELAARGLYLRDKDPLASTEFTYTRFLTPTLAEYRGWALFMDCDFLVTADIAEVFDLADERYAVMCVKHDHRPKEALKMDGVAQTVYPRKNWSSFVLWNCGHPANRTLTSEVVNRETGAYLHRFSWLADELIGALPETWNWLEGWCKKPEQGTPKGIHYTRGGPWFSNTQEVDYADLWLAEAKHLPAFTPLLKT